MQARFADLADDIVIKVPVDEQEGPLLVDALRRLLQNANLARQIGIAAASYVREECAPGIVGKRYAEFIRSVVSWSGV